MLAIISARINKNNFFIIIQKTLFIAKTTTYLLHTNKICLRHLRQSQGLKTNYKTLFKILILKINVIEDIAPAKHQACPLQGAMGSSTMNTLLRRSCFQIKLKLVSHTFKTAYVFMKYL
jgi:hypothetical protein